MRLQEEAKIMSSRSRPSSPFEGTAFQLHDLARSMADGGGALHLSKVVQYAKAAIEGAEHGAISVARAGREPETLYSTDDVPMRVDSLQYALNEGPCVAALTESDLVLVNNLETGEQFPRFSVGAVEFGVRSMLSTRLFLTADDRAALNLYSSKADAFRFDDLPLAAIFGSFASLLLLHQMHEDTIMHLERALQSNREIGVAIGILMAQHHSTREQAFEQLSKASQKLNRRLRDIAEEVGTTGELPSK